jgi:ribonuclease HI
MNLKANNISRRKHCGNSESEKKNGRTKKRDQERILKVPAIAGASSREELRMGTNLNIEACHEAKRHPKLTIYARGCCPGLSGPGAAVALVVRGTDTKEIGKNDDATTMNRMELLAVILGLEDAEGVDEILVVSRAKYVTDAFNKGWLKKWKAKGWMKNLTEPVANQDLWSRLDELVAGRSVWFEWAGKEPAAEMLRAKRLAVAKYREVRT